MTARQTRFAWGLVVLTLVGLSWLIQPAQSQPEVGGPPAQVAPEKILPQDSILYVGWDGQAAHEAAWQATAAYDAFHKTGLTQVFRKLVADLLAQVGPAGESVRKTLRHIERQGISLAVSIPPDAPFPTPHVTIVLHEAAELEELISNAIRGAAEQSDVKIETRMVSGRKVAVGAVQLADAPSFEFGWWIEGKHLVLIGGLNAVEPAVAVAAGKSPNLTANPLWKKHGERPQKFQRSLLSWFEVGRALDLAGNIPLSNLPPDANGLPPRVKDALRVLGLDGLGAVVSESGFDGRASWSETHIEVTGPRRGLLALSQPVPIRLDDLPPMPVDVLSFSAGGTDWNATYEAMLGLLKDAVRFAAPPEQRERLVAGLDNLPAHLGGFDPQQDLLAGLGPATCAYQDLQQVSFSSGLVIAMQVQDYDKVRAGLDKLQDALNRHAGGQATAHTKTVRGRELRQIELHFLNPTAPMTITYGLDKDWLTVGTIPQTVEAFFLRREGKLESWTIADLPEASRSRLPEEFKSLSVSDPRQGIRAVVGLLPVVSGLVKGALHATGAVPQDFELPLNVADFPPAELVMLPLFPNVSIGTVDEDGFHYVSRSSAGDVSAAILVGATAGAVAILLPAVHSVRDVARQTQSLNNLVQLGLALHNHDAAHGKLPTGTRPNEKLKPEKRLSWIVSVLDGLDQEPLQREIHAAEKAGAAAWDDEGFADFASVHLTVLQNPGVVEKQPSQHGPTHYVGIAGFGEDCATLPAGHKRAGIFGYDRVVTVEKVTTGDGLANTLMLSEASEDFGPWIQGGTATVRGFTKKPYIDGPDGIGGPFSRAFHVGFADGSARALSKDIAPDVLEALSTYNGGELVDPAEFTGNR